MKLENDRLCVEIAEQGAEVTRIYDKKSDIPQHRADQRDPVPDFSAWFCVG